jgi:signal transduction histidine kinase
VTLPKPHDNPPPWRESVLEVVLRVASACVPIAVAVAVPMLSSNGKRLDVPILTLAGVALAVIALRVLPQLGFQVRAMGLILLFMVVNVTVLATTGALPGASLSAGTAAVLAAILFNARAMVLVLALTAATHVVLGSLAQRGVIVARAADLDWTVMRNWVRTASTTAMLSGVLAAVVAYVVKQLEAGTRALRTTYQELSVLHRKLDFAKEQAERMVSQELQTETSQTLAALKLRLELWRSVGPASAKDLDEALVLVDEVIASVHSLTVGLRPPLLDDFGLEPALRALVEAEAREASLEVSLETSGLEDRLPFELETACFRIVEEAVTYAARQAHARHLIVSLRRGLDDLRIRVLDDGEDSPVADSAAPGGPSGPSLVGIRARVHMLGGELSLSSSDREARGRRVEVTLPLRQSVRESSSA